MSAPQPSTTCFIWVKLEGTATLYAMSSDFQIYRMIGRECHHLLPYSNSPITKKINIIQRALKYTIQSQQEKTDA
jgi:hypothetical protein